MQYEHFMKVLKKCKDLLPDEACAERASPTKHFRGQSLMAIKSVVQDHLAWMIGELEGAPSVTGPHASSLLAKEERWLGFIQGVLWTIGLASIDELREMNKEPSS
jgi:hypothetical protein